MTGPQNESADRLLGILDNQEVDGPVAQLLDKALEAARAEGRREAVRDVRERLNRDSYYSKAPRGTLNRILDESEHPR